MQACMRLASEGVIYAVVCCRQQAVIPGAAIGTRQSYRMAAAACNRLLRPPCYHLPALLLLLLVSTLQTGGVGAWYAEIDGERNTTTRLLVSNVSDLRIQAPIYAVHVARRNACCWSRKH